MRSSWILGREKGDVTNIDRLRGEGASRICTYTLDARGLRVKEALFSNDLFPLPDRRRVTGDPRSGERRGLKTTAVNVFETARNR